MSRPAVRDKVVYDCNVLLQSLLSESGPAAACVQLALARSVELFLTRYILDELRSMTARPTPRKLGLTDERVEVAIGELVRSCAVVVDVPDVYRHPIDEKDSHYVNVAVAVGAALIVSRDNHFLNLTNPAKPWSREFRERFAHVRVLRPDEYLAERQRVR